MQNNNVKWPSATYFWERRPRWQISRISRFCNCDRWLYIFSLRSFLDRFAYWQVRLITKLKINPFVTRRRPWRRRCQCSLQFSFDPHMLRSLLTVHCKMTSQTKNKNGIYPFAPVHTCDNSRDTMNSSCLVDTDTSLVLPTIGIYDIYRHILPSGNISC